MLHAAILSVVLTLASGPHAILLCRIWCDPQPASATACHHGNPGSPGLVGTDSCDDVMLSPGAFVREDGRRWVSFPDVTFGTVPRSASFDARVGGDGGSTRVVGNPGHHRSPRTIPLRI